MKIAIMGTGGVGGYFGARLAQGGADVAFVARGAHLAALQDQGLRVESPLGDLHLPDIRATDDPATLGRVDFVLVTVKLWDTEAAARAVAPIVGPRTGVISFQNGVQRDEILRAVLGDEPVMGGVSNISATIARPGVIRQVGTMQRLIFGEYDGSRSERAEAFLEACRKGGIEAVLSPDIRRGIWEKFVFLASMAGATTAMRTPIGPIRANPQTRAFLRDLMQEAVAVGRAQGVNLAEDFAEQRLAFVDGLPAEMTSSMHHDFEQGNRLEVPWLSGGVVALGRESGVPTPLHRAVFDILALHAEGRRAA